MNIPTLQGTESSLGLLIATSTSQICVQQSYMYVNELDYDKPWVTHGIFALIVLIFSEVTDSHPVTGGAGAGRVVMAMPEEHSCCYF